MPIPPKNQRHLGYLLPTVIDPEDNICVCVPVPKDWGHIRAFLGQLTELAKWQTWEKDGTTSASEAARRWFDIVECVAKEIDCIMADDCGCGKEEPTNTRINPETGEYEVSYDGGDTWEPLPSADPRSSGLVWPPLPGDPTPAKKCAAANSVVGFLETTQQGEYDQLVNNATIADMIASLIAVAAGVGLIFGILPGAILAFFAFVVNQFGHAIAGDFNSQFTTATWDELLCIIYCNMDNEGAISEEQWQLIKSTVETEIGGYAGIWLKDHINLFGVVGMTNAARASYPGTRDCDTCAACEDCTNLNNWTIVYGTLLEQSPGYMRLASAFVSGSNVSVRIANYNNVPNECCQVTYNIISGVVQNQAYYPCGSANPVFSVPPADTCMYDINLTNIFTAAFEVEFFFSECP